MKNIRYYETIEDDFVESSNQDYKLKDNYEWIHTNIFYKMLSYIVYYLVLLFGLLYSKLILRVSIKNKKVLKGHKGYYMYSNHTQVLGDVLDPFLINFPRKPYLVCSPANLGIPVIGKVLPMAGALPITDSISKLSGFKDSLKELIDNGKVITIYPEAHLWPWYIGIREPKNSPFHFPVESASEVFVSTVTYKKSRVFKKPNINIYIDGPIIVDKEKSKRENIKYIHDEVYNTMIKRSKLSNYEYIEYKKKD